MKSTLQNVLADGGGDEMDREKEALVQRLEHLSYLKESEKDNTHSTWVEMIDD